jgi:hypothetical protein
MVSMTLTVSFISYKEELKRIREMYFFDILVLFPVTLFVKNKVVTAYLV